MTLFTLEHPNGTKSTRESNKDLRWAVVVYTPKETREAILDMQVLYWDTVADNQHRALADGTITFREYATHVGGLTAASPQVLLEGWTRAVALRNRFATMDLPDLYQATHWFDDRNDAARAADRLQEEYDNTPWQREVYYTNELYREG